MKRLYKDNPGDTDMIRELTAEERVCLSCPIQPDCVGVDSPRCPIHVPRKDRIPSRKLTAARPVLVQIAPRGTEAEC